MRLLVISDLHIGVKARTKELCPYPEGEYKDNNLVASFLESMIKYQNNKGKFDYLIIPGDITHNSNLIEYDCGTKFLGKVTKVLGIKYENIIFVPGNHDVDWSVLSGVPDEEKPFRKHLKYSTLNDDAHIFSKLKDKNLTTEPYIQKWEYDNAVFFGFNSSWHDDSAHDKHYGLIQIHHIQKIREELEITNLNKLKIFVVHHHLHQFENPHAKWIDISVMQNAQPLINLLSEFSFNFVIHGHRHLPNFLSTTIESFNPINILCSGSYSCEVPTEIAGYVGNTFHIIEIDSLNNSNSKCKGRIVSMAYDQREGWIESKANHGIEYESPFGNEVELSSLIDACVQKVDSTPETVIFYNTLVGSIPDLKYLPSLSKRKLLEEVKNRCKLKIGNTADDIIFIKS